MGAAGNGTRRWAIVALILALLVGACGSGSGQVSSSATTAESTIRSTAESTDAAIGGSEADSSVDDSASSTPLGVLAAWTRFIAGDEEVPPVDLHDGDLSITKCSWHGPGRWTVELAWKSNRAPTPEQPIDLWLVIGFDADPPDPGEPIEGRYGFIFGTARLIGNGSFTIPISGSKLGPAEVFKGWWTVSTEGRFAPAGLCGILVLDSDSTMMSAEIDFAGGVQVTLDPVPLETAAGSDAVDTGAGRWGETVESLAMQVPLSPDWQEHPMAALALLVAAGGVPVDQLFFDPARPIESIDVKHIAPCVAVTTVQVGGTIRQTRDCESVSLKSTGQELDPTAAKSIDTPGIDSWNVEAVGPADFIDSIRSHAFIGGVDPAVANSLDEVPVLVLDLNDLYPNEDEPATTTTTTNAPTTASTITTTATTAPPTTETTVADMERP